MKIKVVFLCIVIGIFALSCEQKNAAEKIIEKSLEKAHGGKAKWEAVKAIIYEKTTIFYDSSGKIEKKIIQKFQNTLQPKFTSKVSWIEADEKKSIIYNGKETFAMANDYVVMNTEAIKKAHETVTGAQYVLWQPYKLLADEVSLVLEGKVQLEDGSEAHKIKAVYPNSETIWWYYFDTTTFLLKENLVKHGTTYSQIKNIQHETKTGLSLHKERKSYTIDSTKNQKYLRAAYHYEILELK